MTSSSTGELRIETNNLHDASFQSSKRQIFPFPLSTLRYTFVSKFIEAHKDIRSVTDLGSGNCRLMIYLKNIEHLEKVNFIEKSFYEISEDVDRYCRPLLYDMLFGRASDLSLTVNCYHADIRFPDDRFKSDLITLIEVIEHLHIHEHPALLKTVFSYYQPKYVIVTTPNREFNEFLFSEDTEKRQFRHYDHKFEWDRKEFADWCQYVCDLFPSYIYRVFPVGLLNECAHLGPGTQAVIFFRTESNSQEIRNYLCFDMLMEKLSFKQEEDNQSEQPTVPNLVWQFIYPSSKKKKVIEDPDTQYDWSDVSNN